MVVIWNYICDARTYECQTEFFNLHRNGFHNGHANTVTKLWFQTEKAICWLHECLAFRKYSTATTNYNHNSTFKIRMCRRNGRCFFPTVIHYTQESVFQHSNAIPGRSQWPRGLRHRSAAARVLRMWVQIVPKALMSVCCECCVLSGRGLCVELITHSEESYRLWCVDECDLETSWIGRPWPTGGC